MQENFMRISKPQVLFDVPVLQIVILSLLFGLSCAKSEPETPTITKLKLIKALPLEGLENAEPSGLTMVDDVLYTISDDHDDTIFKITILEDKAILEPHIRFKIAIPDGEKTLDLEGITRDDEGNFYLVSESTFRILKVSADGKEVSWATPSLQLFGRAEGLFQRVNANLEGITFIGGNKFVLCAERQPRGILEIDLQRIPEQVRIIVNNESIIKPPRGRAPDYSGLYFEDDALYVLERGAHAICQIDLIEGKVVERTVWSYADIENREDLVYSDKKYGHGEGLYMDDENIYVILDNGGDHREIDPNDRRPLLLIMERPKI